MRTVLHLIETDGPGGAETVYLQLIRSLDAARWRSIAVVPGPGWLHDQLVASGVRPIIVPDRHAFDFRFYYRLVRILKRERVDIIHAHLFGSAVRAALISWWSRVPAIATLHGEQDIAYHERFRSVKVGIVNRGLKRIVLVSDYLRRSFLEAVHFRKEATTVISNGILVDKPFEPNGSFRDELGIPSDAFVIGAIGNPGPSKAFDVLLAAAQMLKRRRTGYRFVIVGDLSRGRGADLIAMRDSLGLTEDVVLPGFRSDIRNILPSFDLYALTSRSEGFSLSIVEAMAAGLPIVSTRCGGPEEILTDGVTGLLVKNGSPEEVAAAIERLRDDAQGRKKLGDTARADARARFSLKNTIRAYEQIYEECLAGARAAAGAIAVSQGTVKRKVLITDGEQRAALASVRSLGKAGYEVHVASSRPASIAGSSRYTTASYQVADPLTQPAQFAEEIAGLTRTIGADVLLPVTEASLLAILPNRERFNCAVPFVDAETFKRICDKRLVLESARSHGIAVPGQFELTSADDTASLDGELRFPLVVKPSRSVAGDAAERISTGVAYAIDRSELLSVLAKMPRAAFPVLVQQRIEGPGFAISVLVWNGEVKAAFAHRRIREKPPSGGVSVLRESIPLDEDLLDRSIALLRDFGWQGVAMVEYKLDARTGVPYLMEINGRLWGSLQLALDAGADFPLLLVRVALGDRLPARSAYQIGVRSRWEWGDVDHLLATLRHSPRVLSLPGSAHRHRRLRALGGFLSSIGKTSETEVFELADPAPFFRETREWFRGR